MKLAKPFKEKITQICRNELTNKKGKMIKGVDEIRRTTIEALIDAVPLCFPKQTYRESFEQSGIFPRDPERERRARGNNKQTIIKDKSIEKLS